MGRQQHNSASRDKCDCDKSGLSHKSNPVCSIDFCRNESTSDGFFASRQRQVAHASISMPPYSTGAAVPHSSQLYRDEWAGRRVVPIRSASSSPAAGAPGPSHLGTGELQLAIEQDSTVGNLMVATALTRTEAASVFSG